MPTLYGPRYRERGSTTRGNDVVTYTGCAGGTINTVPVKTHRSGTVESCYDIVSERFHARSAKGEVINNEFSKVKQVFDGGGLGSLVEYLQCPVPLSDSTIRFVDWRSSFRNNGGPGWVLEEVRNSLDGTLISPGFSLIDEAYLVRSASTSALAGVDKGEAQLLVTLAEFRRTMELVRRPLAQMDELSKIYLGSLTAGKGLKRLSRAAHRKLSGQYLAYYYGMKPLIGDLKNYLEAYLREGSTPKRETARGSETDTKEQVIASQSVKNPGSSFATTTTTVEHCSVRAGNLYCPTPNDYHKLLGMRLTDVPSAMWEATTLSFLADYVSNIGRLIQAIEPRPGVSYLASWVTVRRTILYRAEVTTSWYNGSPSHAHTRPSNEWVQRVVDSTHRIPKSPYGNIGLALRRYDETSSQRNLALVALLYQRIGRIGSAMAAVGLSQL